MLTSRSCLARRDEEEEANQDHQDVRSEEWSREDDGTEAEVLEEDDCDEEKEVARTEKVWKRWRRRW